MEGNTAIKLLWPQDKNTLRYYIWNVLLCSIFIFFMCEIGGKDPNLMHVKRINCLLEYQSVY